MTVGTIPHTHWHSAGTVVEPGPAVIFDLDGVLADALHRQHFLHQDTPDWDGFYGGVHADDLIKSGKALLDCMREDVLIVILTARVDAVADVTRDWLRSRGVRFDLLVCRPPAQDDEARVAVDYKREEVDRLRKWGIDPILAIDDNRKIVDMFGEFDIPAVYFPSGYYDSSSRYDGGV